MITVQLTESDFLVAQRLHVRWTRNDWLTYGLGYALLVAAGILLLISGDGRFPVVLAGALLVYVPIALWFCTALVRFLILPRRSRKLFRHHKALHAPYTITWDDERMTVTSEDYMQRSLWTDFLKWREDDRLVLLYYSPIQFRLVPIRAFPDEATRDAFTRLVREKVPPHKSHRF
jgi:hypothetical protein